MKKRPAKTPVRQRAATKKRSAPAPKSKQGKPARRSTRLKAAAYDIKDIARRWFEELWNRQNRDILKVLLDPAAVGDTEGGRIAGHAEFIQKLHEPLVGAFPDLRLTLDDIVADGDSAAVRWTFEATHRGDTLGIPATNRRVKVSGMSWMKCRNGRLVAGWDRWNSQGLLAYLKDGVKSATVRDPADA